jgi:curved DNA-binding protein CbpA
LAILGLKAGATADEVRQAHKRLMKDFHPDKGGTDYLASKINAAKDVLLNNR